MSTADDLQDDIIAKKAAIKTAKGELDTLEDQYDAEVAAKVKYECTKCGIKIWGLTGLDLKHGDDNCVLKEQA